MNIDYGPDEDDDWGDEGFDDEAGGEEQGSAGGDEAGAAGDGRESGHGFKREALNWLKTAVILLILFGLVIGSLVLYTGSWPPVVVVESGSMMHDDKYSEIGAIDTADMVLHKKVEAKEVDSEITTWMDREERHYGAWGDVIIYKKNGGGGTPILHRAVVWVEANLTGFNLTTGHGGSFDIPSMDLYGVDYRVYITEYPAFGFSSNGSKVRTVLIDFHEILGAYIAKGLAPSSGFITLGDRNDVIDQPGLSLPIQREWVIGKAVGEIPWYGLVNLKVQGNENEIPPNSYIGFSISLIIIVTTPFLIDIGARAVWRRVRRRKGEETREAKVLSEETDGKAITRDEWDSMDRDGWDAWDEYEDGAKELPPPPPPGLSRGRRGTGSEEVADTYWEWYYHRGRHQRYAAGSDREGRGSPERDLRDRSDERYEDDRGGRVRGGRPPQRGGRRDERPGGRGRRRPRYEDEDGDDYPAPPPPPERPSRRSRYSGRDLYEYDFQSGRRRDEYARGGRRGRHGRDRRRDRGGYRGEVEYDDGGYEEDVWEDEGENYGPGYVEDDWEEEGRDNGYYEDDYDEDDEW